MLDAVDGLEIGLHHQPESPRVDIYHSFVERFVGSLEQGHHPYQIKRDNLPLSSQTTVNPYAAIKDGRAALLNFGFQHRLSCREIATISQDLDHLKELNIRGFQARQPGNVEVVEDLLTIQDECIGVVLSLWNHQFPTWFHLSMLAEEQRGSHVEELAPLVLNTWSVCRELGVGGTLDRIQNYQLHCVERAGAAAHQLMVPGVQGFDLHLQNRLSVIEQADSDRPFYNVRWSAACKRNGRKERRLLGGAPSYDVPFCLPPSKDWVPTTLVIKAIVNKAPTA